MTTSTRSSSGSRRPDGARRLRSLQGLKRGAGQGAALRHQDRVLRELAVSHFPRRHHWRARDRSGRRRPRAVHRLPEAEPGRGPCRDWLGLFPRRRPVLGVHQRRPDEAHRRRGPPQEAGALLPRLCRAGLLGLRAGRHAADHQRHLRQGRLSNRLRRHPALGPQGRVRPQDDHAHGVHHRDGHHNQRQQHDRLHPGLPRHQLLGLPELDGRLHHDQGRGHPLHRHDLDQLHRLHARGARHRRRGLQGRRRHAGGPAREGHRARVPRAAGRENHLRAPDRRAPQRLGHAPLDLAPRHSDQPGEALGLHRHRPRPVEHVRRHRGRRAGVPGRDQDRRQGLHREGAAAPAGLLRAGLHRRGARPAPDGPRALRRARRRHARQLEYGLDRRARARHGVAAQQLRHLVEPAGRRLLAHHPAHRRRLGQHPRAGHAADDGVQGAEWRPAHGLHHLPADRRRARPLRGAAGAHRRGGAARPERPRGRRHRALQVAGHPRLGRVGRQHRQSLRDPGDAVQSGDRQGPADAVRLHRAGLGAGADDQHHQPAGCLLQRHRRSAFDRHRHHWEHGQHRHTHDYRGHGPDGQRCHLLPFGRLDHSGWRHDQHYRQRPDPGPRLRHRQRHHLRQGRRPRGRR